MFTETQLQKLKNKNNQLWLNVASSVYVLEDFVNLDNHIFLRWLPYLPILKKVLPSKYHGWMNNYLEASRKAIMLQHDCRKALNFPDNSVDHILCSHFLEHVFPDETMFILNDFKRVLKPGATLHVIVPDIENNIKKYLNDKQLGIPEAADKLIKDSLLSKENRGTLRYRLMELYGGFGLQHRWMYDYDSMRKRLLDVGFELETINNTPSKAFRANDDSVHLIVSKRV